MDTLTTVLTAMSRKLKKEATEKQVEVLLYDAKEGDEVDNIEEDDNKEEDNNDEVDNEEEDNNDEEDMPALVKFPKEEEEVASNNKGLLELMEGSRVVAILQLLQTCS